jgi:hypothetical protein
VDSSNFSFPNQPVKSSKKLYLEIFLALVVICAGFLLWKYYYVASPEQETPELKSEPVTTSFERNINNMKKIDQMNQALPSDFPKDIPIYAPSTITDKYNLQDERLAKPTESVVVFKSSANPEEIKQFYLKKLENTDYKYIQDPNAPNTDQQKVLAFFNPTGILIVIIDKTAGGSLTTVRFSENIKYE